MPVSERERQVLLFNLRVLSVPEQPEPPSMGEILTTLRDVFVSGKAVMKVGELVSEEGPDEEKTEEAAQEGENLILIKDIHLDAAGYVTMLLHHGDASAADPALIQFASRNVRRAGKKRGEGVAHAAHLIVSTTENITVKGDCRALLERVPNLGRSTVMGFLNRLLRKHAQENTLTFEEKDTHKVKRYHPKLAYFNQLSKH